MAPGEQRRVQSLQKRANDLVEEAAHARDDGRRHHLLDLAASFARAVDEIEGDGVSKSSLSVWK
jgi:hypothetical protein